MTATPQRVLVTGASGKIGSAVTALLAARGVAVTGLAADGERPDGADRWLLADAAEPDVIEAALDGVDALVHLAAIPHPSHGTPERVFSTNVVATFRTLAAAGERGIRRAVIASSINASGVPMNRHRPMPAYFPLDERLPADIEDAYSLSKSVDESTAAMAWRRWGIDSVALRFPLVVAPEHLDDAIRHHAADPAETVREAWAWLDVRDAAEAVWCGLVAPFAGAHVVGLSAADTLMARPTEELLAEYAPGVELRRPMPGRSAAVDTALARRLLGFEPSRTAAGSVRIAVA